MVTLFFFSSRRRHTRSKRDWSSDVCSSDLETVIREDKRLSTALTENPLDPELHEEAALLIGSFAMRESAGSTFCDIRRCLCKMTAHMALARAVRQNPGACGTLAEAILCSLTGRETPAFALLDQLQQKAAAGQDIPAKAI